MIDKSIELKNIYINEIKIINKISPATCLIYEKEINEFAIFLNGDNLFEVSPLQIEFYLNKMKEVYSDISIKRKLSSLNGFYKFLQKKGHLEKNPFLGITFTIKKVEPILSSITLEDFENLKNICDGTPKGIRDKLFITLLMKKETRINDIINIKINDIINKNEICFF